MTTPENGLDIDALIALAGQPEIRRLEGDDLFLWAKLMAEVEHIQQRVSTIGKQLLAKNGYDARYTLTDDGFILTQDDLLRLQHRESGPDHAV